MRPCLPQPNGTLVEGWACAHRLTDLQRQLVAVCAEERLNEMVQLWMMLLWVVLKEVLDELWREGKGGWGEGEGERGGLEVGNGLGT